MGDDRIDAQEKGEIKNPTDNNLTISTKLSTDQLICKTPKESPNVSVKSLPRDGEVKKVDGGGDIILYLGVSQIVFGLLMAVFGALVLVHDARLARVSFKDEFCDSSVRKIARNSSRARYRFYSGTEQNAAEERSKINRCLYISTAF